MPPPDFPFDAILFDLDGTLVATELFWPEAARLGATRAFAELGLDRPLPTSDEWMSMVGLDARVAFGSAFPELEPAARQVVLDRCLEAEAEALRRGQAAPLPGTITALTELRARGVRLGIASNCPRSYLEAMMNGLGLSEWIEEPRCLDSPGIVNKADMVEDLLTTFGTRSAVMVGDRAGDRDAAWANGLPHVHLTRGYATPGERVECEATIERLDELLSRLLGRERWLRGIAGDLRLSEARTVGITGGFASGKTLFARDLARLLGSPGAPARVLALADFRRPGPGPGPGPAGADLDALYDLEAVQGHLREPGDSLPLLLEGPCLTHPALRPDLDRLIELRIEEAVAERRIAGREGRRAGPHAALEARGQRAALATLTTACATGSPPDRALAADNPLGPG